jgi:tetratricopeptide (TPR) repeat protein
MAELAGYVAKGLRAGEDPASIAHSEAAALAIIVFFFVAGFLIAYLWVRLYLQRALDDLAHEADRVDESWKDIYRAEALLSDGRLAEAKNLIEGVLRSNPFNPVAVRTKGRLLKRMALAQGPPYNQQLLQEAWECASQVVKLLPEAGGAYYNRACYAALLGRSPGEVTEDLKRAFQLNPNLKANAATDLDLASYRKTGEYAALTNTPGS